MSLSRNITTFRENERFSIDWECTSFILPLIKKIPQMPWPAHDVQNDRSTVRFSKIPNNLRSWRSPMFMCGRWMLYSGTAPLVGVFIGGALIRLVWAFQPCGRSKLSIRFEVEPVRIQLAPVRCVLTVSLMEKRAQLVWFWKKHESARKPSRLWTFVLSRIYYCESVLFEGDFFMMK